MLGIVAFSQAPFSDLGSSELLFGIDGVSSTSAVGSLSITGATNLTVTGQSATGDISGVGVNAQAIAVCPSALGTLGSVSVDVDGEANVSVSGFAATGAVGSITVHHNAVATLSGVSATGSVGSTTYTSTANITPIGVSATGSVSEDLIIWFKFDTTQTPNYSNITTTQTPNWEEVA